MIERNATTTAERFDELVEAAGKAPSPDNNQPWAFRLRGDVVEVFHCRKRAVESDVVDMFSWLALGAAIENLVLQASSYSLTGTVRYESRPFEIRDGFERIAMVQLTGGGATDPLQAFISERTTNRRPYERQDLNGMHRATAERALAGSMSELFWLEEPAQIRELGRLVAICDRVRFEHQPFHDELHRVLRFGDAEAKACGDGLELKTLEMPSIAGPFIRWLRPWRRMRFMNRIGLSRLFAGMSRSQVNASGALGLLVARDRSDVAYLESGRSLQRIWLAMTGAGLAMQPLGSIPLFLTKLQLQGNSAFLARHAERLSHVVPSFYSLFPDATGKPLVMLFRVGRAQPPSARALRLPIEQIRLNGGE